MTDKFKIFVVNARLENKLYLNGKCPISSEESGIRDYVMKKLGSLKCGKPGNRAFKWIITDTAYLYFIPCMDHLKIYKEYHWKRVMRYDKI